MNEQNYEAWDGKTYPWPPPSGWYLAHDQKWWPEGYGPKDENGSQGTAAPAPEVEEAVVSAAAPVTNVAEREPEAQAPVTQAAAPLQTEAAGSGNNIRYESSTSSDDSDSNIVKWLGIGVGVLAVLVIGLLLINLLGGSDSTSVEDPYALSDTAVGIFSPDDTDNARWAVDVVGAASTVAADQLGALPTPPQGEVYVQADVELQNLAGNADLSSLSFKGVSGGTTYELDASCMSQPGSITSLFNGQAAATGFVCWRVPADVEPGMVLAAELAGVEGEVFFAIR